MHYSYNAHVAHLLVYMHESVSFVTFFYLFLCHNDEYNVREPKSRWHLYQTVSRHSVSPKMFWPCVSVQMCPYESAFPWRSSECQHIHDDSVDVALNVTSVFILETLYKGVTNTPAQWTEISESHTVSKCPGQLDCLPCTCLIMHHNLAITGLPLGTSHVYRCVHKYCCTPCRICMWITSFSFNFN